MLWDTYHVRERMHTHTIQGFCFNIVLLMTVWAAVSMAYFPLISHSSDLRHHCSNWVASYGYRTKQSCNIHTWSYIVPTAFLRVFSHIPGNQEFSGSLPPVQVSFGRGG